MHVHRARADDEYVDACVMNSSERSSEKGGGSARIAPRREEHRVSSVNSDAGVTSDPSESFGEMWRRAAIAGASRPGAGSTACRA